MSTSKTQSGDEQVGGRETRGGRAVGSVLLQESMAHQEERTLEMQTIIVENGRGRGLGKRKIKETRAECAQAERRIKRRFDKASFDTY